MAYKIFRVTVDIQRAGREPQTTTSFHDRESYQQIIKTVDDLPGFRAVTVQEVWVRTIEDLEKKEGR